MIIFLGGVKCHFTPQKMMVNVLTPSIIGPGFLGASGADDPEVRRAIEARVPIGRLGQPYEVAHFCASLLDGVNYFQTGQFFSLSGGWSD